MEHTKRKLLTALGAAGVVGALWLIIDGQKKIGYPGLCEMLAGLGCILLLLYLYNRTHR